MIILTSVDDLMSVKKKIEDSDTLRVLNLVLSENENVFQFLKTENPNSSNISEGMCLVVSRFFNNILKENGFNPTVLQGDIELSENDWLEHHVSFLRLSQYWITIDFAPSEINRYKNVPLLVLITEPDKPSLKNVLKNAYNWWVPEN